MRQTGGKEWNVWSSVVGQNVNTAPELCTEPRYIAWCFRKLLVPRESGLWGGGCCPDYPGIRTTEGKLHGVSNVLIIITGY